MYKEIKCEKCGKIMEFVIRKPIQLGVESRFAPGWASDSLPCEIYVCPECGEYHFYKPENDLENPNVELVKCNWCKKQYDKNYPFCPECGHKPGDI
ncbi:MAG: hypothetical protein IKL18_00780 [Oscillospiraceae bacterium]|nr:hypothetical protein [Oscillospiraceae bacterium]MBR6656694.1 hypothetical protein [Oscillospiraceae bacterium]